MSDPIQVVNRREQRRQEPEKVTQAAPQDKPVKDTSSWIDVAYMVALMQQPQSILVMLRAVGVRSDNQLCVADYCIPPLLKDTDQWIPEVRKRLDTFLGCTCSPTGPCGKHKFEISQWMEQDAIRINNIQNKPLSPAMEMMAQAQRAMEVQAAMRQQRNTRV